MSSITRAIVRASRRWRHGLRTILLSALVAVLAVGNIAFLPATAHAVVPIVRTALPTGVDWSALYSGNLVASGSTVLMGDYTSTNAGQTWTATTPMPNIFQFVGGGKAAWWSSQGLGYLATVYSVAAGTSQTYPLPSYAWSMNATWSLHGYGAWTAYNYVTGGIQTPVQMPAGTYQFPSPHLTSANGVFWQGLNSTGQIIVAYASSPTSPPSAWTPIDGLPVTVYGQDLIATGTQLVYGIADQTGLRLCSKPLTDLTSAPSCTLADAAAYPTGLGLAGMYEVAGAVVAVAMAADGTYRPFVWNGPSSVTPVQLGTSTYRRLTLGDTLYMMVTNTDTVPSIVKVNGDGSLGAPLPTFPTWLSNPLKLAVTPAGIVGSDSRDGSDRTRVWSRSVTGSTFGSESFLPRRASDFAASAARTVVSGAEGLSVYDRGVLQTTLPQAGAVQISGPYVQDTYRGIVYRADDGATVASGLWNGALFGSTYVAFGNTADPANSTTITVTDLTDATPDRTVTLPAGTGDCYDFKVWNDLAAMTCEWSTKNEVYNLRTGQLVASHPALEGHSSNLLGVGDGYALLTEKDAEYNTTISIWDLAKNTTTALPDCTWLNPVSDGVGHVACASDTSLVWEDFSALSTSAPRLLGALAKTSVDFSVANTTWGVDLDTTKALKAGTVVITNSGGTTVRTLSTVASADGSVRNVVWNGLDNSGRPAPVGVYSYRLVADATDGTGTVVSVDGTTTASGKVTVTGAAAPAGPGSFASLSPSRILDTRASGGKVKAAESRSLQVTGQGGVPASGVSAVVLNVTVTETTSGGYLTVSPTGTVRPTASNLNWAAGATIPNAVTVKVGTGGKVDLFQSGPGTAQVIVDVAGYYSDGTVTDAGGFTSIAPARILDTRSVGGTLTSGESRDLQITGAGGVPVTNVSAVVLNTTVTDTTSGGFLTVHPSGTTRPNASNLNWTTGKTIPNLVTVKVGDNGKVSLFQSGPGTAQVIVDVAGYYLGGTPTLPGMLVALAPARVLDTRTSGKITSGTAVTLPILNKGGIPATGVSAIVVNTTVTDTTAAGFLTVYPGTSALPTASNLNWVAGSTIPNLVTVQTGTDGTIKFHNGSGGTTQIIADTAGYYLS